ncbi:MAG: hypothetical protein IPN69_09110 [Acidobacteria bacterium]|nr:hypothetical protein [Acidobacteriota bacterium]MBK8810873.1 hypothetical protein [Acidobacteriota bacterium]
MRTIGLTAVVLFLAALASFVWGFLNPTRFQSAAGFGVFFFAAAALILAVTIWRRTKTERI